MDKKKNIAISTVVSVATYIFLLSFIVGYITTTKYSPKINTKNQEVAVDITSVDIEKKDYKQKEQKNEKEELEKEQKVEDTVAKKEEQIYIAKNIKNLFDDVNITYDEKNLFKDSLTQESRRKSKSTTANEVSEEKSASSKLTKNIIQRLEKLDSGSNSGATVFFSDGASDAYFDKIYEAVSNGWSPKPYQKGMTATVVIKIDKNGEFDYFVKRVAGDDEFLSMLKKHMEQLQKVRLPKPEKKLEVEINFITRE
ncbi:MAG: hypothetical protein QG567_68 [Campylobacterota bacterium]|nr:hypothetical protein [Campylobacterota bacterium]